jgi:DNA invertase Pin-like site-specific DNA recombinase
VRSKSSLHAPQEWKLVDVFVENEGPDGQRKGRTATKREGRRGLAKALELAKLKLIDVVVVTKLDRLARDTRDYIDISAEFNENEVALVCLDLDIDTSTPDGQMIMRNHANLAQWQAERISQYSLETVLRHLKQGRPIGPPPLGYCLSKDINGKTTYVPDPVYRKHIEFIDQLY